MSRAGVGLMSSRLTGSNEDKESLCWVKDAWFALCGADTMKIRWRSASRNRRLAGPFRRYAWQEPDLLPAQQLHVEAGGSVQQLGTIPLPLGMMMYHDSN